MQIRVAGTVSDSIVDGPGIRYTVFTQGCPHNCPGCHNPQTHDFAGGKLTDTDDLLREMGENPLLDGVTLSGGEPFCQCEACAALAKAVKEMGMSVWAYSGWTFDELVEKDDARALLAFTDVLVDGPFVLEQRSLEIPWRGSRNQRLVDVPATLAAREKDEKRAVILYNGSV